jgi:hypothetical protein
MKCITTTRMPRAPYFTTSTSSTTNGLTTAALASFSFSRRDSRVDGQPVIKDLDADILADDPRQCTRGHWIASTILRRLRRPIHNVRDLVAVRSAR